MESTINTFIIDNFLFGDGGRLPAAHDSLIETGIVDSTGILEVIEFLESEFGITVDDDETVPENLGSIANLVAYVDRKRAGA